MRKKLSFSAQLLSLFFLIKVSSLIKISFIIGSVAAFFSAHAIAMPLVGYFTTPLTCALIPCMSLALLAVQGYSSLHYLAYHLPGLCAGLYFKNYSRFFSMILPGLCMILFCLNPASAWVYSLFWLIPFVIGACRMQSLVARTMASTFIAHAVGSVLWIYTMPTSPHLWISLMPVVLVERLLFAASMSAIIMSAESIFFKKQWWIGMMERCGQKIYRRA